MDIIARNSRAEQYICAARKNFIERSAPDCLSESTSRMLIGHFTDLHGDVRRFRNALTFFEHFQPDFAIHTGDLVAWNTEDDSDYFFEGIKDFPVPIFNCIGNHDTFSDNGPKKREELYDRFIKPLKGIRVKEGKCYYYVDFQTKKIRLIVLNDYDNEENDCCAILQEQCDWLIGVLKEAADIGYGVIIAAHDSEEDVDAPVGKGSFCQRYSVSPWKKALPKPLLVPDIVDAFRNAKKLKKSYEWWYACTRKVDVDCSFKKKGEFICYLCGHRHSDWIGYLKSYPDQLSMTMTCSGCFPPDYHNIGEEMSDLPRIPGTVTEDAINFYVIDRKKRTVTVVRVGACINDLFEERLCEVFPY